MNIFGDTLVKDRHTQTGPMVMIKGVDDGNKFVRQLTSKNFIRASDMSASPDGLKKSVVIVGEWRESMEICEGSVVMKQDEEAHGRSVFYAEFPIQPTQESSSCASKSGTLAIAGQANPGCDVHAPKARAVSFPKPPKRGDEEAAAADEKFEATLITALTSGCNADNEMLSTEVGVIARLLTKNDAQNPPLAKVLIHGDAVVLTLDAFSVRGKDAWIGGTVRPTSTTCSATKRSSASSVRSDATCFLSFGSSTTIAINTGGLWIARLEIDGTAAVEVKNLHFEPNSEFSTSSSILPFVFSDGVADDYNIHVVVKGTDKYEQTSFKKSSFSGASFVFPEEWQSLLHGNHHSAPTTHISTSFTITELDEDLVVTLPSPTPAVRTKYVLSVSEHSSSNVKAGISNFYALYPAAIPSTSSRSSPPSPPLLDNTLISFALQTAESSEVVLTKLESLGAPKVSDKVLIPSALLSHSIISLLPKVSSSSPNRLVIASRVATIDDLPSYSIVTTSSHTASPTPIKPSPSPPVKPSPSSPVKPSAPPPVAVTAPEASPDDDETLRPVVSTPPTNETEAGVPRPLFDSPPPMGMSNTTKWSIFAIVLVVIAIAAFIGYRFYYAKYIAPLAQRHEPLASSPSDMELDP